MKLSEKKKKKFTKEKCSKKHFPFKDLKFNLRMVIFVKKIFKCTMFQKEDL